MSQQNSSIPGAIQAVYVVGPSSSGKTTLCRALAAQLKLPEARLVHEVARDVMKATGFSRATVHELEMQRTILVAQAEAEERAMQAPSDVPILLCDRSAIDPLVYAALGFDGNAAAQRQAELLNTAEFQAVLDRYRASLFVLLPSVAKWVVDDGVRSLERPDEYHKIFRDTLSGLGISARELGRDVLDLGARVDQVIAWMRGIGYSCQGQQKV